MRLITLATISCFEPTCEGWERECGRDARAPRVRRQPAKEGLKECIGAGESQGVGDKGGCVRELPDFLERSALRAGGLR
jgi:hypothetical protein